MNVGRHELDIIMEEYQDELSEIRDDFDEDMMYHIEVVPLCDWPDFDAEVSEAWGKYKSMTMPLYHTALEMGFTLKDIQGWYDGSCAVCSFIFATRENVYFQVDVMGNNPYCPCYINLEFRYGYKPDNPNDIPDEICRYIQRIKTQYVIND